MKYSTFELKNPITHPFFFWPETLVSFAADDAIPAVQDKNGKRYNCQTYEGKIHFLSGLNCGEHKIFTPAEDGTETKIRYREVEDFIIVDNHKFKLKIPKSRRLSSMDSSVFLFETASDFHAAARLRQCSFQLLETEILAKGDVFFKVRLSVKNADSSYSMVITVVYDYDFVSVDENMRNMEGSCLEISTEDLLPEHWHATTWPDDYWERRSDKYGDYDWKSTREPFVIPFNGEDPAFFNIPDDPDAFQVRLGAYVPFFAYSVRPCASFWNQNGASLGFFIANHANWDEGDYTIWGSSERIDGRFYYKKDVFTAKFALNGNSRSFGMAIYHRDLDERWFKTLEQLKEEAVKYGISEEEAVKLTCFPTTYTAFLHNRYPVLNLNDVKQWQL